MWFFFRRRERPLPDAETRKPRPLSFARIVQGFGDFQDLRAHDAALKFWLPEPAEQALVEFCELAEQSRSEWLRQFFVVYAYGLLALTVIDDRCPGFFRDQRGIRYSMSNSPDAPPGKKRVDTYWVPELGKNIVPLKVWIPRRLKDDLTTLAEHAGLPLSQFVREIVIARLLGHGTLPARPLLIGAEPTAADAWCEDREVPWRQASADEYRRIGEGEVRWHYEDATDDADAVP